MKRASKPAVFAATTQGFRDTNQDRFLLEETSIGGQKATVLAIADGMGGAREGDRAAEIAVECLRRFAREELPQLSPETLRAALQRAFQEANRRIWAYSSERPGDGEMGTTLVCAVTAGDRFLVANAGDSRCYYLGHAGMRQLTTDHSHVQELVRRGSMTPEQARRSPFRNQLTNALGEPSEIRVDLYPAGEELATAESGAALLLCSDGLHGEVADDEVEACLRGMPDLPSACAQLLSLAVLRGSRDNVTVIVKEMGTLLRAGKFRRLPPVAQLLRTPAALGAPGTPRRRSYPALTVVLIGLLGLLGVGAWVAARNHSPWTRIKPPTVSLAPAAAPAPAPVRVAPPPQEELPPIIAPAKPPQDATRRRPTGKNKGDVFKPRP
jgi:protein phosphatase